MQTRRLACALVWSAFAATAAPAQELTTLPGTERLTVTNERTGFEYRVDVSLPPGHATSGTTYPVLFLLDGNLEFAMAVQIHRMMRIDGIVPPLIIVGIGYHEDDPAVYTPAYAALRERDYTPTALPSGEPSGRAADFLTFIRDQLIPMVERRYRADPADRALGGHSLGGLFTAYALLHEPMLFRRYWLASPSLWWDGQVPFTWLASARQPAAGTRVFLSVGALEGGVMRDPMKRMTAELRRRWPPVTVESMAYPGENHGSVVSGSMAGAFRSLYARRSVPIAPTEARRYVGRWVGPTGSSFTIAAVNGIPTVTDSALGLRFTHRLRAYSRDTLFDESFNIPYVVERGESGKPIRFKRVGIGPDSLFVKKP